MTPNDLTHGLPQQIDWSEPYWRFEERVTNLMNRGRTRTEAEEIVKRVIVTKELDQDTEGVL